ncbi:hypothetical protein VCHA54P489_310044 [Vibrio chagasii]|nr:hypothetical protein VCHA54P489_310044 [Vibrio chagasii]CAH7240211.1 hypothetical protein VCHA54P500_340029 [Vibrio chagasii]CAH7412337.1 hypothetical protein VCHA53O462_330029 [Vibrio chagasii]
MSTCREEVLAPVSTRVCSPVIPNSGKQSASVFPMIILLFIFFPIMS